MSPPPPKITPMPPSFGDGLQGGDARTAFNVRKGVDEFSATDEWSTETVRGDTVGQIVANTSAWAYSRQFDR